MKPHMTPVTSSHVQAVGHDEDKNEMHVQFKTGKTYIYEDVSPDEHGSLVSSGSIGSALHDMKGGKTVRRG